MKIQNVRSKRNVLLLLMALAMTMFRPVMALTNDYSTIIGVLTGTNNAFDTGLTSGLAWVALGVVVGALFFGIASAFKRKPR